MLYFAFASITNADLDAAYNYVEQQLQGRLIDHLIELDDWKKALEKFYPDQMREANQINEAACESADENTQATLRNQYLDKLREITQNFAS